MTIRITQKHPASKKIINMHSVDNLYMHGERVELPDALRFAKQRKYIATVHQEFDHTAERNPSVTYSITKEAKHDATYTVTVRHTICGSSLHYLRCTVTCDASDGYASHTFKDIDNPRNIAVDVDSLFYKAFTHGIVSEGFLDDALDFTVRDMHEAEQHNTLCLN